MSLLKSSLEIPTISSAWKVQLEPYVVESLCEICRLLRDKGNSRSDVSGLLFGTAKNRVHTVEALKTFTDAGTVTDAARRERLDRAYKTALEESKADPEFADLDVVGWFTFRKASGLLGSDVVFHNQYFHGREDLALILWREGPSQFTVEAYAKAGNEPLSEDNYAWASVRLSADIRHMREPVELNMSAKVGEDLVESAGASELGSQIDGLMRRAEAAGDRLFSFLNKKREQQTANEKVQALFANGQPFQRAWLSQPERQAPQFNPYAAVATARPGALPTFVGSTGSYDNWQSDAAALARRPEAHLTEFQHDYMASGRNASPPAQYSLTSADEIDFARIGQAPRAHRGAPREVSGLPMLLQPQRQKTFAWPLVIGLFIACSAVVFVFFALGGEGGRLGQTFHAMFPGGELNLRVRNQDSRMLVTWNQNNRFVASATEGNLQILDGQTRRDVHLDGRQVADGSVLYRPLSNDVTFRLEVRSQQGGDAGSVRVLDGFTTQNPVLDVSAPATDRGSPYSTANGKQPDSMPLRPEAFNSANSLSSSVTEVPTVQVPGKNAQNQTTDAAPNGETTINSWDTPPAASKGRYRRSSHPAQPSNAGASGFVAPRPLTQIMPRTNSIPAGSVQSRTRVQVQVDVDPNGKVAAARLATTGVNEAVASAALAAARQWTFDPATNNGQRVQSGHTIVFEFRPEH